MPRIGINALLKLLAEHTGQSIERIHQDTERDFVLGPQEAVEYGVVDEVVARRGYRLSRARGAAATLVP
jgi:ATP-dependent protease ClpP protease subunit